MDCSVLGNQGGLPSRSVTLPNAGAHLPPEAGAQRTLEAVRCSAWLDAQVPQAQRLLLAADYATNRFCSRSLRHNARMVANSR